MKLSKRIKQLQDNNRPYVIKKFYLIEDSYNARETINTILLSLFGFLLLSFVLFWIGNVIYSHEIRSRNPEFVRLDDEREKNRRSSDIAEKEAYVKACIEAGKAPADFSNTPSLWECK